MRYVPAINIFAWLREKPAVPRQNIKKYLQIFGAAAIVIAAIIAVVDLRAYQAFKQGIPHSGQHALQLGASPIDPSWIVSGSPVFHSAVFEGSVASGAWSGIWECIGPAKFVWHYDVDETIYIRDGAAEVEYLGETFELRPGDYARFVSGTTATWVVRDHVKKTFSIHNPGRFAKAVRHAMRLFGAP
jgi:uncharacterized protein